ncbi:MAG TPA: zinc-binding dehydrogenase [Nitriliruptoraceae bacterium]|nr:zinc-binding dehydrogenase [Nitriliruptoraceae bacterium]
MLAVTATSQDPDDPLSGLTISDRPEPTPPAGWEVVTVKAAALNHHDLWSLRGVGLPADQLPRILGCDAAAVTEDGDAVVVHAVISDRVGGDETLAPDTRILSEREDGTFAQRLTVPSRNLVPKPSALSFVEAACLPTSWLTAYRMLFTSGRMQPGQRVLVQGAGGGVSTALLVLARAAGLHVTVTSRSSEKLARAEELGAHVVVESGARLPARVDAVMETVGAATWDHSLKSLVPGGTVVVAGSTSGPNPPADLQRVFFRQLRVVGSTMGTRDELVRLIDMLEATGARPLIDDVLPLDQAAEGFAKMERGDVFGKVVFTLD